MDSNIQYYFLKSSAYLHNLRILSEFDYIYKI